MDPGDIPGECPQIPVQGGEPMTRTEILTKLAHSPEERLLAEIRDLLRENRK